MLHDYMRNRFKYIWRSFMHIDGEVLERNLFPIRQKKKEKK
jgi:hypothetical protein